MATRKSSNPPSAARTAPRRNIPGATSKSPKPQPESGAPQGREEAKTTPKNRDSFYRAFEERHRGSREMIKERLKVYLPFALHCQELYEECAALDLGCGRGEWLELMQENGFQVLGVDLDEGMLEACGEKKLPVENKDALAALKDLPSESQSIISGFHIAEHLSFDTLKEVVRESLRVLKPGGLLILETPNPENLVVGTSSFYLDPTHLRPLPPELLSFLPEHYGFERTKILRLQESPELRESSEVPLLGVLNGASPDYALIAQKKAGVRRMRLFDGEFEKNYGLTLQNLAERYEAQETQKLENLELKASSAAEGVKNQIEERLHGVEQGIDALLGEARTFLEERLQGIVESADARFTETHERVNAIEQAAGMRIGELRADIAVADQAAESHFQEARAWMDQIHQTLETRFAEVETDANQLQQSLEVQLAANRTQTEQAMQGNLQQIEERTRRMEAAFCAIRNSRSWKMTAPYRALGDAVKNLWQGVKNLFKPAVAGAMRFVIAKPSLNKVILALLSPFPGLKARLKGLALARNVIVLPPEEPPKIQMEGHAPAQISHVGEHAEGASPVSSSCNRNRTAKTGE